MTPESRLKNQIKLYCGERNWLCYHVNVATVQLMTGQYFRTGLPKGFPDLLILTDDGRCIFCETKIKPRKPTTEQLHFINNLQQRGFKAFVAYDLNEFISEVN